MKKYFLLNVIFLFFFFKNSIVRASENNGKIFNVDQVPIDSVENKLPSLRLNLFIGRGILTGKTPANLKEGIRDHFEQLKAGHQYGLDLSYFLTPAMGFGVKYSKFSSSVNSEKIPYFEADKFISFESVNEDLNLTYVGVGVWLRRNIKGSRTILNGNIAGGKIFFNDKVRFMGDEYSYNSGAFGLDVLLGLDVLISKNIAIGFDISVLLGVLSEIKSENFIINIEGKENLSRVNFGVSLKYLTLFKKY